MKHPRLIYSLLLFVFMQNVNSQSLINESCSVNTGDTVIKVHTHSSGETWYIVGSNNNRIFRMDKNKNITEKTSELRQFVNSSFSSVYVTDTNKAFIGTKGDYLVYYKDDSIQLLESASGINDSIINYVSGEKRFTQRHNIYCASFDKLFEIRLDTFYNITSVGQLQNSLTSAAENIVLFQHHASCVLYAFSCFNWARPENVLCFEDPGSYYIYDVYGGLPDVTAGYIESRYANCSPFDAYYGYQSGLDYVTGGGLIPKKLMPNANITDILIYKDIMLASSLSGIIYSRDSLYPVVFDTLMDLTQSLNIYDMSVSANELFLATSNGLMVFSDTVLCSDFDVNIIQDKDTIIANEIPGVRFETSGCFSKLYWYLNSDTITDDYVFNYVFNQKGVYDVTLVGEKFGCIDSAQSTVFVIDTLSSIDHGFLPENYFNIYPNPSMDNVTIYYTADNFNNPEIIIYDVYGAEVNEIIKEYNYLIDNNYQNITLSGLSSGLYLIELRNNLGRYYKRLVIN